MDKCRNCSDVRHRNCPAPNVLQNGILCCEREQSLMSGCSQCGVPLRFGHFAYEPNWREFWCEECLRAKLDEMDGGEGE